MTEAERDEHIAKTLAMISEEEEDSDDEEDDPVQAWVDFDRRCKITSNVEAPRGKNFPCQLINRFNAMCKPQLLSMCFVHFYEILFL